MPTFEITTPDGRKFRVEGENAEGAFAAIQQLPPEQAPDLDPVTGMPAGMVLDPSTRQVVDTRAEANARRKSGGFMSGLADMAGQFVSGAPFVGSYLDEAAGKVGGAMGQDPALTQERARAQLGTYEEQNPATATGLKIAGGITGALPVAMAAAPTLSAVGPSSLGGQVLVGMGLGGATGAAEGTVSGYGRGTDDATRRSEAVSGGMLGGATGFGIGGLAPAVGAGLGSAGRWALDRLSPVRPDTLGISRPAASILNRAMEADGSFGGQGIVNVARAGDDAMLADAGPNARMLLDTSIQRSGPAGVQAGRAIEERAGRAGQQMQGALDSVLGSPQGISQSARDIASNARPALSEAYGRAYSLPIDYASEAGRNIEATLSRVPNRILKSAIETANEAMQVAGVRNKQILADIADDGSITFREMPNVQQLDELKKALGEIGASDVDQFGRPTASGNRAKGLARDVRDAITAAVPEYAQAVKLGGDKIGEDLALDMGRKLLRQGTTREEVAALASGASDAERRQLAQGIRFDIEEKMANVQRAVSDGNMDAREAVKLVKELSSRANREKVALAIGDEPANILFANLDRASMALDLRAGVQQNSKTFARQSMDETIKMQQDGGIVGAALDLRPLNTAQRIAQALTGRTPEAKQDMADQTYKEIARLLTQTRGPQAQAVLQDLATMNQTLPRNDAVARAIARGGALTLAAPGYATGTQIGR